jgi:hypothetical protein
MSNFNSTGRSTGLIRTLPTNLILQNMAEKILTERAAPPKTPRGRAPNPRKILTPEQEAMFRDGYARAPRPKYLYVERMAVEFGMSAGTLKKMITT